MRTGGSGPTTDKLRKTLRVLYYKASRDLDIFAFAGLLPSAKLSRRSGHLSVRAAYSHKPTANAGQTGTASRRLPAVRIHLFACQGADSQILLTAGPSLLRFRVVGMCLALLGTFARFARDTLVAVAPRYPSTNKIKYLTESSDQYDTSL